MTGVNTHGISRLPAYLQRGKLGATKKSPADLIVINETPFTAFLDANDGLGQVACFEGADISAKKANENGIGAVVIKNSGHIGRAGNYSKRIAEQEYIGLCMSNASPRLAPWGGMEAMIGNNPWSIAFPGNDTVPTIVLDIACSQVAAGKIRQARDNGESIPLGWALDCDGKPTNNPVEALEGILLPMAAHKGYGIALVISLITGVLGGSSWDSDVSSIYDQSRAQKVTQFLAAISIDAFAGKEEYELKIVEIYKKIKYCKLADGFAGIYMPGEIEEMNLNKNADYINISKPTMESLVKLGKELRISFPKYWASSV